jgi:xanthine dehydrogenase molybdopterin-binding subunit B
MGSRLVRVTYGPAGVPILNIDDAIAANSFYNNVPGANWPINVGDVNKAFQNSDVVFDGFTNMGSQIHFHMEPQVTLLSFVCWFLTLLLLLFVHRSFIRSRKKQEL